MGRNRNSKRKKRGSSSSPPPETMNHGVEPKQQIMNIIKKIKNMTVTIKDPWDLKETEVVKGEAILEAVEELFLILNQRIDGILMIREEENEPQVTTQELKNEMDAAMVELKQNLEVKVKEQEDVIKSLKEANDYQKKQIVTMNLEAIKANLIIQKVPVCKKAIKEKREETNEESMRSFEEHVLQPIGIEKAIRNYTVARIPSKNKKDIPNLKVVLCESSDKQHFFKNISNSGLSKSITIKDEYPALLKNEYKEAEKVAYKVRKSLGIKTKIVVRLGEVVVLVKKKEEKRFSKIDSSLYNQYKV